MEPVIVVAVVAIVVAASILERRLSDRSKARHDALSRVAGQWGGRADWKSAVEWIRLFERPRLYVPLAGATEGAHVHFSSGGEQSSTPFTEFQAPLRPGLEPWVLRIRQKLPLKEPDKLAGLPEVRTGQEMIDDAFLVRSDQPAHAAAYFSDAKTRDALLSLAKLELDAAVELDVADGWFKVRKAVYLESEDSVRSFMSDCIVLYQLLPLRASFPLASG